MKCFFIVDYKKNSGLGHLKRSFLIAKELYNLNNKIYFLCNQNLSNIEKKKFEFIKLNQKNLKKNLITIKKEISLKSPDLIIFDTYEIDQKIIDYISKINKKIMIIHDYKFFKKNVHIYLTSPFSKRQANKNLLIGPRYALVEKKNKIVRNYKKKIKIKLVSSVIMNQLSYHVSQKKLNNEGLFLNSDIEKDIKETIKLLKNI